MLSESNYFDHLPMIDFELRSGRGGPLQLLIVFVIYFYKSNKNTHIMVNILYFITCLTKNF